VKTIVHIDLGDAERNLIATYLERKETTRMVSRKEVTELVQQHINDIVCQADAGEYDDQSIETVEVSSEKAATTGGRGERDAGRPDSVLGFVPSRGDEDYLSQPKDIGVAAACSRILDDAALIEQFAWDTVERNRKA